MKKFNFQNRGQGLIGIIIILAIVALIGGGAYYYFSREMQKVPEIPQKPAEEITKPKEITPPKEEILEEKQLPKKEEKPIVQKCTDGTPYGECSHNKPKYCDNGNLVDKCTICECPLGYYCNELSELCYLSEKIDMLIFISPQYANDSQIVQAINEYREAVKKDIGWETKLITITSDINDFRKIDEIIEDHYKKSAGKLKTCLMIGEDIDTALSTEAKSGELLFKEEPSVTPWATLEKYQMVKENENIMCSGVVGEEICEVRDKNTGELIERFKEKEGRILKYGTVVKGSVKKLDIVISLLYPTHHLDYQIKSQQIINALKKFSRERNKIYPKKALLFLDATTLTRTPQERLNYRFLNNYTDLIYKEDPSKEEVLESLKGEYAIYAAFGHGSPEIISVNGSNLSAGFKVDYLDSLNTPIFIGSGCYTAGWFANVAQTNDRLDPAIARPWFGSKILTNPYLRVEILGGPDEGCDKEESCVFRKILTHLLKGKTLAESIIKAQEEGIFYDLTSAIILYGDPTFHYNF
jgi:hypothetical protein